MRIITQSAFGGPEVLELSEVPTPIPGPGEVGIKVAAIGVNPVDAAVRAGQAPLLGDPPFTLGWDVAGEVSDLGPGVTDLRVGERVFAMPAFPAQAATYAEEVVASAAEVIRTPSDVDDVHAAALPLVSLTAYQALVEAAQVADGTRVLIHAAGGGFGHVAVQIAKALGAHVVGTASPRKVDFVAGLGADEVVDYTVSDVTEIEPVDLAIDPLGGATTPRTLQVVRPGGVLALLVGEFDDALRRDAAARGVRLARISVVPNRAALEAVTDLVAGRQLVPYVSQLFALDRAADAHRYLETGVQGKVVLLP